MELDLLRTALAGRYRVERLLGQGGMATVYLAEDERHRRQVAIKVLRPELAQTIGIERFHREIEIAARLNHPHILPLLDSGTLELGTGKPASAYYVMPFVPGESLRDRLSRDQKLPLYEAVRLAREIADALDYAHRHGVIHRDIKPENVLLSEQHAVIADFGIARALDEAGGGNITKTGQSIGSPTYMSPEQISGDFPVDGRTDQYALGCTLFEMLTGQPPWSGGTLSSSMVRRMAEEPPRIRAQEPGVPPQIEQAIATAMAREPDQRFKSPAEFAAALELGTAPQPMIRSGRRRGVVIVAAAVLAVVVFGLTQLVRPGRADAITSVAITPSAGGQDSSTGYLSEGIQSEVVNLLRRLPMLRVTAPSVVAQLRDREPKLTNVELGERLKVGAVLTWNLTRTPDSAIVSVELAKVPGGDLLWNARYAKPLAELAMIQGMVAQQVSDNLRLQLTGSERATMARRPTTSAAAYDLYLRARKLALRGQPLGAHDGQLLTDSSAYFDRKAIELDSSFALAYGSLGTNHFVQAYRGWGPFVEHIDTSLILARRALALDSTQGDPWLNLISKSIYLDDDWTEAQTNARRGLRLAAHDAGVLQFAGIVVGEVEGRLDSAIALLRRAVEQEPSIPTLNTLGDLYLRAGRWDSAVTVLKRAVDLDPSVPGPRRRLIRALEQLKRYDEAIAVRREGGDTAGVEAYAREFRAGGAAGYEKHRREDLQRQLEPLLAPITRPYKLPDDTVPQLREERIAALYAQLGEWSKAMDWVLAEYQHRPRRFRLFVTNPDFAGLRNDPRFLPLVKKEGLEGLLRR